MNPRRPLSYSERYPIYLRYAGTHHHQLFCECGRQHSACPCKNDALIEVKDLCHQVGELCLHEKLLLPKSYIPPCACLCHRVTDDGLVPPTCKNYALLENKNHRRSEDRYDDEGVVIFVGSECCMHCGGEVTDAPCPVLKRLYKRAGCHLCAPKRRAMDICPMCDGKGQAEHLCPADSQPCCCCATCATECAR